MKRVSKATFNNYRWSKADHDLMVALLKEGKNYDQIAKCLGRSAKAIEQHVYSTRKKLKDSGMSDDKIIELLPTNPRPRHKATRKIIPYVKNDPTKHVRKEEELPKPTAKDPIVDSQLGNLLIACWACAVGIWFMVGILVASII
ncbi:MAG: hypothetical protein VW879_05850 [Opitutae bacterium]